MVLIAASTMFLHEMKLKDIFALTRRAGLDSLEFWLETPDFWLRGLPDSYFSACISEYPDLVPLSVHAPVLDLNPCSINPDVAQVSVTWTKKAIMFASLVGASVCTIHPGRRTAHRPAGSADYSRLNHLLEAIESASLTSSCMVAIENMEPKINALLCTPEQMTECLDAYSWLYCTIDICHTLVHGDSNATIGFIDQCQGRIANIHLSRPGPSGLHQATAGDPVIEDILWHIRDTGYNGLITSEINDLSVGFSLEATQKEDMLRDEAHFIKRIFSRE